MIKIDYQELRENAESTIGILENIAGFEPSDIDGDTVELRFETDGGFDTGCDVSIVDQCQKTADVVRALLDERERNQQYIKSRDQENEEIALTVGKLRVELEAAEKRNAKLQSENAYIRNRFKELDLLIGKNILVMQAAIIEWQATGDAKSGLAWIYNTLFGPGELPDESEKDAQAYFNRKYAPIDEKLMEIHKWFWEQSEAERAAGIRIKGE
ncbi:ead/Ea22-like family protein [Escherichia coli]|nr:ead/Ea22-like family protein [Escherichia coli]MDE5263012.1 ead/Ea22-like family protein [Escherichia coli]